VQVLCNECGYSGLMVDLYWAYGRLMVEKCIDDDISSKNYVKIENLNTDLNLNSVLFKKIFGYEFFF